MAEPENQFFPSQQLQIETADKPPNMLEMIVRAAADPSIDVAKMDALRKLRNDLQADAAAVAFNEAMALAQAEIQPVARNAENTQTRSWYAKLESVDEAIRPIYLRHGFSVSYNTIPPLTQGHVRVQARCRHVSGHFELYDREAAADTLGPKGTPVKTALHGGASTETFLKRYLLCGIFNVVFKGLDDDGQKGGMQYITGDQLRELDEERRDLGVDLGEFCRALDVESLVDLNVTVFPVAKNLLKARRRRAEKQGA